MEQRALRLSVLTFLAMGCAPSEPASDEGELDALEGAEFIDEGKADDFLSLTAREYVVSGTATVTLEDRFRGSTEAQRMTRARELVSMRQIAIAWFLNQYLVDKEHEDSNADYGGFGAMSKAGDYEALQITRVGRTLEYTFQFRQLLAGRTNLMTLLPLTTAADGSRTLTLTVGRPTNEEMARLETNHEWYRQAPWDAWNPSAVPATQKEDLVLTIAREVESQDAWLDYQSLFADGVLDLDVHFGWDYHDAYHVRHARALFSWLRNRGFTAPVSRFDQLTNTSGAFVRTIRANGRDVRVEVRIFYGKTGSATDPDTDAGGRQLEADARASLASRDVIVYSGHSGPFYGFALGNWRETEEGDLDDSEMASVPMANRYQIVFAEGCDTYQIGAAFRANPAHRDLARLDVITTTSFSNAESPAAVQDFITRLIERDSRGRHRPRTVSSLLRDLDANPGAGFHTMYGMHGVDDNPQLHPYAEREMMGEACSVNADCGELGNLCVRAAGERLCTAACTTDAGCGEGWACRQIASNGAIYGRACMPL
jgi:hypothetical protein